MNLAVLLALIVSLLFAQQPKQVVVTGAVPDAAGGSLTITGENFGFVPFVTLNLVPLTIDAVGGNRIVAVAPIKSMPAGTYVTHYGGKIHYDGAKDEETVIEVHGIGPAASKPAERK